MFVAPFVPALIGGLAGAMGSLAGRALIALGIGFVSYTGIDLAIGAIKSQVLTSVQAVPVDALNLIGYLWLDKAMTVVFSAITIVLSMKLIGGTVKSVVIK